MVSYWVVATDATSNHNTATSEIYTFEIVSSQLLDDFESGSTDKWDLGTGWGLGGLGHNYSASITDSPDGDYENNSNNSLTYLGTFNLSTCAMAALSFWYWYFLEDGHDFGYVEASADGGEWTKLTE